MYLYRLMKRTLCNRILLAIAILISLTGQFLVPYLSTLRPNSREWTAAHRVRVGDIVSCIGLKSYLGVDEQYSISPDRYAVLHEILTLTASGSSSISGHARSIRLWRVPSDGVLVRIRAGWPMRSLDGTLIAEQAAMLLGRVNVDSDRKLDNNIYQYWYDADGGGVVRASPGNIASVPCRSGTGVLCATRTRLFLVPTDVLILPAILNVLFYLIVCIISIFSVVGIRTIVRCRKRQCLFCGYPAMGGVLAGNRCSECGNDLLCLEHTPESRSR